VALPCPAAGMNLVALQAGCHCRDVDMSRSCGLMVAR
jgi:hypothetical protein